MQTKHLTDYQRRKERKPTANIRPNAPVDPKATVCPKCGGPLTLNMDGDRECAYTCGCVVYRHLPAKRVREQHHARVSPARARHYD